MILTLIPGKATFGDEFESVKAKGTDKPGTENKFSFAKNQYFAMNE
jgi:hypothetical protein